MNKFLLISALVAIGIMTTAQLSLAGQHVDYEVTVGSDYAFGSLATARSSGDSQQRIGCYLVYANNAVMGYCSARSRTGQTKSCLAYDAGKQEIIGSVGGGSYVFFRTDSHGLCSYLYVANDSKYAQKSH